MKQRQQNSTLYPIPFLMIDGGDHVTGKTGLTPTVTLSKNGGAFAAAAGAVSEVGNGWYRLAASADDRDTPGELVLHASAAGADPTDDRYVVVPWNPFDATRLGLAALPGAAAGGAGGLATADAGNAVKIQSGTGAGQLALDAGRVTLAPTQAFDMTGDITGNLVGDITGSLASLAPGSLDAAALADPAAQKIADAVFTREADGTSFESIAVALLATLTGVTEVAGPTVVFKRRDGGAKVTITYGAGPGERVASEIA